MKKYVTPTHSNAHFKKLFYRATEYGVVEPAIIVYMKRESVRGGNIIGDRVVSKVTEYFHRLQIDLFITILNIEWVTKGKK